MNKRDTRNPEDLKADAAKRNARMDEIDRAAGFAAPTDCPIEHQIRTAMSALDSALAAPSQQTVSEAWQLLKTAHIAVMEAIATCTSRDEFLDALVGTRKQRGLKDS